MKGEPDFLRTRELLSERGFIEDEVRPVSDQAFGSWVVTLRMSPRVRVVWDGKDQRTLIEAELFDARLPAGASIWRDIWIGRQGEDLTPESIVRALEHIRDYSTAVAREARR